MRNALPRILFAFSAVILLVGGLMHAAAFGKAVSAVSASDLPPFYGNSLKGLWLIDAATLMTLAVAFGCLAARPALANKPIVILLGVIPAATAFFLYKFIGNFLPAHMLVAAAAAALVGVWRLL
jgi:hypothetical protein